MNPVPSATIADLKSQGYRITKARMALLDAFSEVQEPLSAADLLAELARRDRVVNKTTVYRELDFLLERGYIHEVSLRGKEKRYELTSAGHHHHLVCVRCETVEDIPLENELATTETTIRSATGFQVQSHSLEFFGLCVACQA